MCFPARGTPLPGKSPYKLEKEIFETLLEPANFTANSWGQLAAGSDGHLADGHIEIPPPVGLGSTGLLAAGLLDVAAEVGLDVRT